MSCASIDLMILLGLTITFLTDAAVLAIRGHSRLHDEPGKFFSLAVLSVPLWLIFEAYNLRLQNWSYSGVPVAWPLALLGYGWSFATIFPGIFETADLIESFGWFPSRAAVRFSSPARRSMIFFGAICLLGPLIAPQPVASRLFALVWIGFIFLLDPINYRLGLPSLIGDFAVGRHSRFYSLLASGFACSGITGLLPNGITFFPCFKAGRFLRCRFQAISAFSLSLSSAL